MHSKRPIHHSETSALAGQSEQLTAALRMVIHLSPINGLGPIEVARALGVDKTLASRLLASLRAGDPLTALSALPGTSPLRQFIRAAREHGADAGASRAAEEQLRAFEQTLQRTFGTRTRLDAALSDELPGARRRHQETARQSVYRGMALIKGISIDIADLTWVVRPSARRRGTIDTQFLAAFMGIRRLRPTARVRLMGSHGQGNEDGGSLLTDLCRPADLEISTSREGRFMVYEISTGPVHRDAASDVFLTERLRPLPFEDDPPLGGPAHCYSDIVTFPYKRLALTILLHEGVWPGCDFLVRAYDTAARGQVFLPDPTREADRLPLEAPVTRARATEEALRGSPVPGYASLIRRVSGPLDFSEFRLFRCDLIYPMYGAQVAMIYERARGSA